MNQGKGHLIINDTNSHDAPRGTWKRMMALAAATFTSVTYAPGYNGDDDDLADESVTLAVGDFIYAPITEVQLAGGKVIMYDE